VKHIDLYIRKKDWVTIILIGVLVSSFLSVFIYYLIDLNIIDGLMFGSFLGTSITILAMVFITVLNNHILPDIAKRYWLLLAIAFSFLSGFCGASLSLVFSIILQIQMIEKIENSPVLFSVLMGVLTYFVGALMYAMVKMANLKEQNEQKLIQSRLKSLETQLNPHFLFNSLNSLAELIHSDVDKSEDMILKLSAFLRTTMEEKPLVTLYEELKNIKSYVELENIRFEDSINIFIDMDEEISIEKIPKFSIQLIVENAIKHGFIKKDGIDINIKVVKKQDIQIYISNNGKKIENKEFGIGLKNLKERVSILCNGKLELIDEVYPTYLIRLGKYNENISS